MRACEICGKSYLKGRQVSHSHIRTIKRSQPNLKRVRQRSEQTAITSSSIRAPRGNAAT